jgi:hypothetical protein
LGTNLDLEATKQRAEAALELARHAASGPWVQHPYVGWTGNGHIGQIIAADGIVVYDGPCAFKALNGQANVDLIIAASTDFPGLARDVLALCEEVERLRQCESDLQLLCGTRSSAKEAGDAN